MNIPPVTLKNPALFQVHALAYLRQFEEKHGKKTTLAALPEREWKKIAARGFDLFWPMGVWERSPASRESALAIPELKKAFDTVLPGWTQEDVPGSPYAVRSYTLDPRFGKKGDLEKLKTKLNKSGLRLILDFVPNHLATDHDWIGIPERFIRGTGEDLQKDPSLFFQGGKKGLVTAHGKDPNFPGWQDTAQINIFSPATREALIGELLKVAAVCDGVRCDMAMLLLNRIFKKTWDGYLNGFPEPAAEFWPEAIGRVKKKYPDFIFIAEVYWGHEKELQGLGFDFTYDKKIYDLLRWKGVPEVLDYLREDLSYQQRSARFVENHDEERVIAAFGREKSYAASAAVATLPGLRFFHEGQLTGRKVHFPIQLARAKAEPADRRTEDFYERLFGFTEGIDFAHARWALLEVLPSAAGDETFRNIMAWTWKARSGTHTVVINYAPSFSSSRIAGRNGRTILSKMKPWEIQLTGLRRS